ncbi:DUF4189 domain-containing protein [Stenotrophomonas sp. PD6]|uniref:DUF4189 domain-containing protein n=1 Tax=Stenotrophomonas sp. PD6 TaxID=3368612 RepID=UPI003B9E4BC3
MARWLVILMLSSASFPALAEGGCPPGQYPIGGQGVQGCAPIPRAGSTGAAPAARPTGEWENRWGAVVEDMKPDPNRPLATGYAVSQRSKRAAISAATSQCKTQGGNKCEVRIAYYNQCVALADPDPVNGRIPAGLTSSAVGAETLDKAKSLALDGCRSGSKGASCSVTYSACSMSEFKAF